MEDEAEHRRLTILALRMAGEIFAILAAPVAILTTIARRLGGGKPIFVICAILVSFVISTVTMCLKAVKYNGQYMHQATPYAASPPPPPPNDDEKKRKSA